MKAPNFPMNNFQLPEETEAVLRHVWECLGAWRPFTIVIDGRDGVGKSVLARYFSYRLNMPVFETDLFLLGSGSFDYDASLGELLRKRLDLSRPLIVEGVFAARLLSSLNVKTGYLLRLVATNFQGCDKWQKNFETYEKEFRPMRVLSYENTSYSLS